MSRERRKGVLPSLLLALATFVGGCSSLQDSSADLEPIIDEWESADGVSVERIAAGLTLPTALEAIEIDGHTQILVAELRGSIQRLESNGSLTEFAEVPTFIPTAEFPAESGEAGLASMCADSSGSRLFATYVQRDDAGVFRNHIMRFDLSDEGFEAAPIAETDVSGLIDEFRTSASHQIGGCQVDDDEVFVSVGDGWNIPASQAVDQLLGKVVRIDADGNPATDNPFFSSASEAESYVWATGLRNPFGIELVGSEVFVAQNGPAVDSLLRLEPGANYLWDGSDESVSANSLFVWSKAVSPVHLEYVEGNEPGLPPDTPSGFLIAIAGDVGGESGAGIQFLPFDGATGRVTGPPEWLVRSSGPSKQVVADVALDGQGILFTAMLPGIDGETGIYRARFDPPNQLPHRVGDSSSGASILNDFGCLSCHQFNGEGGQVGPPLDPTALRFRLDALNTPEYEESLEAVEELDEEPWASHEDERREVLSVEGEERILTWVRYRIMEPRFDRTEAQMPNLGISEDDAQRLAEVIVAPVPWWRSLGSSIFGEPGNAVWFATGGLVAVLAIGVVWFGWWWWRRRQKQGADEPTT